MASKRVLVSLVLACALLCSSEIAGTGAATVTISYNQLVNGPPPSKNYIINIGNNNILPSYPFRRLPTFTESIAITNSNLRQLPQHIAKEGAQIQKGRQIKYLDLSNNKINSLPHLLFYDDIVGTMDLSHNSITTIVGGAFFNTRLEVLDLSHNILTSLAPNVFVSCYIRKLNLDNNRLTHLPRTFYSSKIEATTATNNRFGLNNDTCNLGSILPAWWPASLHNLYKSVSTICTHVNGTISRCLYEALGKKINCNVSGCPYRACRGRRSACFSDTTKGYICACPQGVCVEGASKKLFGAKCPKEWLQRRDGLKVISVEHNCFLLLSSAKLTWEEARYECWSRQGYLAEIDNRDNLIKITQGFSIDKFWTGFNDRTQEGLFLGNYYNEPVLPKAWKNNEPNGNRGENCMVYRSGGLTDYNCRNRYNAVCQFDVGRAQNYDIRTALYLRQGHCSPGFSKTSAYSRSCFKVFRQPATWQEADSACLKKGYRLAHLQNWQGPPSARHDQWTLVAYLARGTGNLWVGGQPGLQYVHTKRQFSTAADSSKKFFVCEEIFTNVFLSYSTENLKRCPYDKLIYSIPNTDYASANYIYNGTSDAVEDQCKKDGRRLPDASTMNCLYDAMKSIRQFFPSFATEDSGPLLKPYGKLVFMNRHGYQKPPVKNKSYRILCAGPVQAARKK